MFSFWKLIIYIFLFLVVFLTTINIAFASPMFSEKDIRVTIYPEQTKTIHVVVFDLVDLPTIHIQKQAHPNYKSPSHIKDIKIQMVDDFSHLVTIEVYSPYGVKGLHREVVVLNNKEYLNVGVITTHKIFVTIKDFMNSNVRFINSYYSMKTLFAFLIIIILVCVIILNVRRLLF